MSFPTGTEMFQFPAFALLALCIQAKSTCFTRLIRSRRRSSRNTTTRYQVGCPIRRSADQRVLSPPHGLSQSATSFIASYRQGIHQTPFMRLIRSRRRRTRIAPARIPEPLSQPARASCLPGRSRSVHRLGKTASAANTPEGAPAEPPHTRDDPQKRLVFLSLHDVKDHKGPNECLLSPRRWVCARRRMATNQNPDHTRQCEQREQWWVWEDSNLRPYAYQAYALTT